MANIARIQDQQHILAIYRTISGLRLEVKLKRTSRRDLFALSQFHLRITPIPFAALIEINIKTDGVFLVVKGNVQLPRRTAGKAFGLIPRHGLADQLRIGGRRNLIQNLDIAHPVNKLRVAWVYPDRKAVNIFWFVSQFLQINSHGLPLRSDARQRKPEVPRLKYG